MVRSDPKLTALLLGIALLLMAAVSSASFAQTSGDFSQGGVIVGSDSDACDSSKEGGLRFNSSTSCLEFCNGSDWTCPETTVNVVNSITDGDGICGFADGTCPAANASLTGCITGESLSWGAVTCTTNGTNLEVQIDDPLVNGDFLGGNNATGARYGPLLFCAELGLQMYNNPQTSSENGEHYWFQAQTGSDWLDRPNISFTEVDRIYCEDDTTIGAGGGGGGSVATFPDTIEVTMAAVVSSSILKASVSSSSAISVSGDGSPEYQICADLACNTVNHAWSSSAGNIDDGEFFQMRMTSSASPNTSSTSTLDIGGSTLDWQITTGSDRYVFIASGTYSGNLGGLSGADATCNSLASAAGLGTNYMAWLATSNADDPESRFTRSGNPYRAVDGTKIADNWSDLVDGTLDNAINLDQNGNTGETVIVTSVDEFGVFDPINDNCQGWTSASGSDYTTFGLRNYTTVSWTADSSNWACDNSFGNNSFLCFQQ